MKRFLLVGLLLAAVVAVGQSSPQVKTADEQRRALLLNASDVMAAGSQTQSSSFQAQNWTLEAEQNPSNSSAWLNAYLWTSRDRSLPASKKEKQLLQIFSQAENHSSQSWQYLLIKYLQSGKKNAAALNRAFELTDDKETLYQYKIQHAIIINDRSLQRLYATELNALVPMPAVLYEYHYNVLMSADSNATIYAQGLNDLVALAVVQHVKNNRLDIQLKYYDGSLISEPNAYLCLSLGADVLKKYPDAGYTGLLMKLSGASIKDLEKSIKRFDLRIMQSDNAIPSNDVPAVYKNYFPSFLLYYKHLQSTNDASKEEWKFLIRRLAERTGNIATVENYLND